MSCRVGRPGGGRPGGGNRGRGQAEASEEGRQGHMSRPEVNGRLWSGWGSVG